MSVIGKISPGSLPKEIKLPELSSDFSFIRKFKELSNNPAAALEKLQQRALSGVALTPSELLGYQVMAHRFGLSIEMATKIADGISTSVRKLQSQ